MKVLKVIVDELPEKCDDCKYFQAKPVIASNKVKSHCLVDDYTWGFGFDQERPDWCPLVEQTKNNA